MMMMSSPVLRSQRGFSLVELAIALVVIGLLLAGITKGQEVIQNGRVNRLVMDVKNYQTVMNVFKRDYGALPGDIRDPSSRLPNCSSLPCSSGGNGNAYIDSPANAFRQDHLSSDEANYFWLHLAVAGLVDGMDMTYPMGTVLKPAVTNPASPVGGMYKVGYMLNVAAFPTVQNNYIRIGGADPLVGNLSLLTAAQSGMIDRKIDDGAPSTGSVVATRIGDSNVCGSATLYPETAGNLHCNVIFLLK